MGVSLASVAAGAPQWISGSAASALWNTLHSLPSNLIFEEGDSYYQVALQVPGITRDAPPAPESRSAVCRRNQTLCPDGVA